MDCGGQEPLNNGRNGNKGTKEWRWLVSGRTG